MSQNPKSCCFIFLKNTLALSKSYSFSPSWNNTYNNCNTLTKKHFFVYATPHPDVLQSLYWTLYWTLYWVS